MLCCALVVCSAVVCACCVVLSREGWNAVHRAVLCCAVLVCVRVARAGGSLTSYCRRCRCRCRCSDSCGDRLPQSSEKRAVTLASAADTPLTL